HRYGDLLRGRGLARGRHAAQELYQRGQIVLGHAVERREGMDGQDPLAIGPAAQADGRDDLLVRPAPDPCLRVGSDVARVHGAERPIVLAAPCIEAPFRLRVTAAPARGAENVLAARELVRLRSSRIHRGTQEEQDRQHHRNHGNSPNVSFPAQVPSVTAGAASRRTRRSPAPRSRAPSCSPPYRASVGGSPPAGPKAAPALPAPRASSAPTSRRARVPAPPRAPDGAAPAPRTPRLYGAL